MKILERLQITAIRQMRRLSQQQLLLILALLIGVLVAIVGEVLKSFIHNVEHFVNNWQTAANVNYLYLVTPAIGITLAWLFVRYWVKDNISHGVTRIFYAISRRESRIKKHNCYTSVVASSVTIGFGGSVGAEAPIVLTGAAIGSNVGQLLRLKYSNITLLLGCGAAAALAAVYKAPIAGFIFVLEVLMLDLTFTSVVPLMIASISAATTTYLISDVEPFFGYYTTGFDIENTGYYVVLALLAGVVSYMFSTTSMKIEGLLGKLGAPWRKILFGSMGLGVLIFIFPPLYGEGYISITNILTGDNSSIFDHTLIYGIQDNILAVMFYIGGLVFFKVVAAALTNGSGGVGGTFAPSLFVGAMLGFFTSNLLNYLFNLDLPVANFTLVGMAAVMSGVMKAPMTSMFLVAELTGGFGLFLPLMLASTVSFALSYYFEPYSIYTKRLAARGELLTHDKDQNTMQFLDTNKLVENDFYTLRRDDTLFDVTRAVENSSRNLFPVLRGDGRLAGVIYLDNIRSLMFHNEYWERNVMEFVEKPHATILEGSDAREVVELFERSRAWNLPVVDAQGKYVGFISKSRLLTAYRDQLRQLSDH